MNKTLAWVVCVGILSGFGSAVNAIPLQWDLQDVTLNDNTVATGYYIYDADTLTYSDWNITTIDGIIQGFSYNPTNSYENTGGSPGSIRLSSGGYTIGPDTSINWIIELFLTSPMTNAGGTIDISSGNEIFEEYGDIYAEIETYLISRTTRSVLSGSVKTKTIEIPDPEEIPEPATLALLGLGMAGLGFSRRKKA